MNIQSAYSQTMSFGIEDTEIFFSVQMKFSTHGKKIFSMFLKTNFTSKKTPKVKEKGDFRNVTISGSYFNFSRNFTSNYFIDLQKSPLLN